MAETKKYLDLTGLKVVWSKTKGKIAEDVNAAKTELIGTGTSGTEDTIKGAKKYTDEKIAAIPAAIVYKADGTTITQSGKDTVTFSIGTIAQSNVAGLEAALDGKANTVHTHEIEDVTGLQDALDGKAASVHTHKIADLTDLNAGWDALLQDAPDVATDTDLTALEGRVDTAESKLGGIEAGAQVNKIEKITVAGSEVSISGKTAAIPAAAASTSGTITENRVKELAGEVAGSVYKVKGTKATIGEVLEVGTAAVGDVYNVTAEFTLNGQKYPAGTNVVFVGDGTPEGTGNSPADQAQWDALGGTVDLTPYAKSSDVASTYATKSEMTSGLAGKAEKSHIHTTADITDFPKNVSEFTNDAGYLTKTETDGYYDAKGTAETVNGNLTRHIEDNTKHLPAITEGDAGKVLAVGEGGLTWSTINLPIANGTELGLVKGGSEISISNGEMTISSISDTLITALSSQEIEAILI